MQFGSPSSGKVIGIQLAIFFIFHINSVIIIIHIKNTGDTGTLKLLTDQKRRQPTLLIP